MNWIDSIKDLLFFLNLYYDKDIHAPDGWTRPETKKKKITIKEETDVQYTSGKNIPYRVDEEGTRTLEWGDKDPTITQADLDIIEDRNLDKDKYTEIKGQWVVKNMTSKKASAALQKRHGKGYGERTVETYWSALNAAYQYSPIA